jgi:hypothetical protein
MSIFISNLADLARWTGYPVVEQGGWATRSNSHGGFDALKGITVHHTASGKSSDGAGDASYITSGSDSAPISNVYISRNGTIYVCAAGSCNHGGKGGPYNTPLGTIAQDKVNFNTVSIEIGNPGTGAEAYPEAQIDSTAKFCAEVMKNFGWTDPLVVFAHKEWCGPGTSTPGRKIDPFGPWESGQDWAGYQDRIDTFRTRVGSLLVSAPMPTPGDDSVRVLVKNGDANNWGNAFIVFDGGKFWLPTNAALEEATKDFGYAPIDVNNTYMEKTGPVVGENPTGDLWGRFTP